MAAVRIAPTNTPITGFLNIIKRLVNSGISASGSRALLMVSIPVISIAKPAIIVPISFFLVLLAKSIMKTPIMAKIGENDDGFSILIKKLSLSIPARLSTHDVTVVPILAPIIIPTACPSCIIPELTNPTTITVVAEEDCITAVTIAPSSTASEVFDVNFSSIPSSFPPDVLASPSPMICIP